MQPKRLPFLAIALLGFLLSHLSFAADRQPMAPIYSAIYTLIKQNLDQKIRNPKIIVQKLGDRTRLPRCKAPLSYHRLQPERTGLGRHTIVVQCPDPAWKIFISAKVSGKLPVVVSTALIPRHSQIRPHQVKRQYLDSTRIPRGILTDPQDAIGMRAKRAIAPNTLIKAQMLLPPYWVHKGKPVTIITRIGSVEVRAKGIAQKNAVENEMVAVKNIRSGKTVRAIVIAPNKVLVP